MIREGIAINYSKTLKEHGLELRYERGLEPPHYPVPAIPLACAIHPALVQIAEVIWLEDTPEFELLVEFEQ